MYKRWYLTLLSICVLAASCLAADTPPTISQAPSIGKLYWVGGNQLSRANLDGSHFEVLVRDLEEPDGLVLDLLDNKVYWTNMARGPNGSLQRADLDGNAVVGDSSHLVQPGSFDTGKEIELDPLTNKLYWADRDGKKVMRANNDGSKVEIVVQRFRDRDGSIIMLENPVGIALDSHQRMIYFTDRFMARILRAPLDAEINNIRDDVETLVQGDKAIDRPIDIDLDVIRGKMYWTDRGSHRVLRANLDGSAVETLIDNDVLEVKDPIGIALDVATQTFVWTDMTTHKIYRSDFDGKNTQVLLQGEQLLAGISYGPLGITAATIEPQQGTANGGQRVAVIGDNFVPGKTSVHLNNKAAINVQVIDNNLLTFITPLGKAGSATLTVATPAGRVTLSNAFSYISINANE